MEQQSLRAAMTPHGLGPAVLVTVLVGCAPSDSNQQNEALAIENFVSAEICASCHPRHYSEWKTSRHAYAMVDPVYRALVQRRQRELGGEDAGFCTQCHSSIGTRGGDCSPMFEFEELQPITLEGVTCEACHKVSGMERPFNSGHVLDSEGPMYGSIADPIDSPFHDTAYSPLHETSAFCAGCHDVIDQQGLYLERPFEEWLASPAAAEGRPCQSCHMPVYEGKAAVLGDAPVRELHSHRWVGVDLPFGTDFIPDPAVRADLREQSLALLRSSGRIALEPAAAVAPGDTLALRVTVENLIDGHDLPTGSSFNRQLWLAVTVTDAAGNVLFRTGDLDANGDLRDHTSELDPGGDEALVSFGSTLLDAGGAPVMFMWHAVEHVSTTLAPLEARTATFAVATAKDTAGPLHVDARLRFRPYMPRLLRTLDLDHLLDELEITDVDVATAAVEVLAPASSRLDLHDVQD